MIMCRLFFYIFLLIAFCSCSDGTDYELPTLNEDEENQENIEQSPSILAIQELKDSLCDGHKFVTKEFGPYHSINGYFKKESYQGLKKRIEYSFSRDGNGTKTIYDFTCSPIFVLDEAFTWTANFDKTPSLSLKLADTEFTMTHVEINDSALYSNEIDWGKEVDISQSPILPESIIAYSISPFLFQSAKIEGEYYNMITACTITLYTTRGIITYSDGTKIKSRRLISDYGNRYTTEKYYNSDAYIRINLADTTDWDLVNSKKDERLDLFDNGYMNIRIGEYLEFLEAFFVNVEFNHRYYIKK